MKVKIKSRKQHASGKATSAVRSAAYRHKCGMSEMSKVLKEQVSYDYYHLENEFVDSFFMMNDDIKNSLFNGNNHLVSSIVQGIANSDKTNKEKNAMLSQLIWTMVEQSEKRKDSQLFREVEVSLYHELSLKENKKLLKNFIEENFTSKGMIADVAIHNSGNNLHAHIMLTMRDFDTQNACFGKKNRDWNNLTLVEKWRADWALKSSESLGREIYHKSYTKMAQEALETGEEVKAKFFMDLDACKAHHLAKSAKGNITLNENKKATVERLDNKLGELMNESENQPFDRKREKQIELTYQEINNIKSVPVKQEFYRYRKNENFIRLRKELREKRELIINVFNKLHRAAEAAKSNLLRGATAVRDFTSKCNAALAKPTIFKTIRNESNAKKFEHIRTRKGNEDNLSNNKIVKKDPLFKWEPPKLRYRY